MVGTYSIYINTHLGSTTEDAVVLNKFRASAVRDLSKKECMGFIALNLYWSTGFCFACTVHCHNR
jgi:hypothetical protein